MKKFILISLSTLIASVVMASTTFTGLTGLTLMPTAEVAPANTLNIALDYYDSSPNALYPIRANLGISDNLEIAANYQLNGSAGGAAVKWVAPMDFLDSNKYAFGLSLIGKGNNQQLEYEVYGAMTKELPIGFPDVKVNINAALACNVSNATLLINPAIGVDVTLGRVKDLKLSVNQNRKLTHFRG